MHWLLYLQGKIPWHSLDRRLGGHQSRSESNKLIQTPLGPKNSSEFTSGSLLSMADKLFKKAILKTVQWCIEENDLLHTCKFGFHACHRTILQCMELIVHVTLNFNNNVWLRFSPTLKQPLTSHGTLAYYTSYLTYNSQPGLSSSLSHFFH
jgi:hypothetical protein